MNNHTFQEYKELFKEQLMLNLTQPANVTMKELLINLIQENQEHYKLINYAYLSVKKEVIGK